MARKKKSDFEEMLDHLSEEVKASQEPKKKGRPKKKIEEKPSHILIDEERFKEERDRIISYFGKLSSHKIGPSEMISVLEDLGVLVEVYDLSKDDILSQLKDELSKK